MRRAVFLVFVLAAASCATSAVRSQLRTTPLITSDGPGGAARLRSSHAVVLDLPGEIAALQAWAIVGRNPSEADQYLITFLSIADSPHYGCGAVYITLDGERLRLDPPAQGSDVANRWVGEKAMLEVPLRDLKRMADTTSLSARWCGTTLEMGEVPKTLRAMLDELDAARARAAVLR